jgi:hypothetical protein
MWCFGAWTHFLLSYVVIRNGGGSGKLKEVVRAVIGKEETK